VTFKDRLAAAVAANDSLVCVGLDPDISRFPQSIRQMARKDAIVAFNRAIIEATSDLVCCYKPNLGFYAQYGVDGIEALLETRAAVPSSIPVLLDAKVGDVGSTATAYANGYFGEWGFDSITVNPYLGEDTLAPFLSWSDRGVFVVCRTSNPGSGDFQDIAGASDNRTLYMSVSSRANQWQSDYPCEVGLVVGATWPTELGKVRGNSPTLPILLPGVGAQAGEVEESVRNGVRNDGTGLLVSSSRGITYAGSGPDFAERAREAALTLRERVNAVRSDKSAEPQSA
jgi:orotidine-5'-phosphate decarboxylase